MANADLNAEKALITLLAQHPDLISEIDNIYLTSADFNSSDFGDMYEVIKIVNIVTRTIKLLQFYSMASQ